MSENGHKVTDLSEIVARTKPARVVRYRPSDIDRSNVSLYDLKVVGRTLGLTPEDMVDAGSGGTWAGIEIRQAIVWVILRREEPGLTWEEAERFTLEEIPDPTTAATTLPQTGIAGSSKPPSAPASRRRTPAG